MFASNYKRKKANNNETKLKVIDYDIFRQVVGLPSISLIVGICNKIAADIILPNRA